MAEATDKFEKAVSSAIESYEHLRCLVAEDTKITWFYAAMNFIQQHEKMWVAMAAVNAEKEAENAE